MKHFLAGIQRQWLRNTFCVQLFNNNLIFFLTIAFHVEVLNVKALHLHTLHLGSSLLALVILLVLSVIDSNEIASWILLYSLQQGLVFIDDSLVFILEVPILVLESLYFLDGLCQVSFCLAYFPLGEQYCFLVMSRFLQQF